MIELFRADPIDPSQGRGSTRMLNMCALESAPRRYGGVSNSGAIEVNVTTAGQMLEQRELEHEKISAHTHRRVEMFSLRL
jgi:hypothetical protein